MRAAVTITSGMTVGLFNRLRSQNGSTKFLGAEKAGSDVSWVARTNVWDAFIIRAVHSGAAAPTAPTAVRREGEAHTRGRGPGSDDHIAPKRTQGQSGRRCGYSTACP